MAKKKYVTPKSVIVKLMDDLMLQVVSVDMDDKKSSEENWNDGGEFDGGDYEV